MPVRLPTGGGEGAGRTARRGRRGGGGCSKMAVAGKGAVSAAVKPIFSRDLGEAKRRVRELYRAWYREVPNAGEERGAGHACAGGSASSRS